MDNNLGNRIYFVGYPSKLREIEPFFVDSLRSFECLSPDEFPPDRVQNNNFHDHPSSTQAITERLQDIYATLKAPCITESRQLVFDGQDQLILHFSGNERQTELGKVQELHKKNG